MLLLRSLFVAGAAWASVATTRRVKRCVQELRLRRSSGCCLCCCVASRSCAAAAYGASLLLAVAAASAAAFSRDLVGLQVPTDEWAALLATLTAVVASVAVLASFPAEFGDLERYVVRVAPGLSVVSPTLMRRVNHADGTQAQEALKTKPAKQAAESIGDRLWQFILFRLKPDAVVVVTTTAVAEDEGCDELVPPAVRQYFSKDHRENAPRQPRLVAQHIVDGGLSSLAQCRSFFVADHAEADQDALELLQVLRTHRDASEKVVLVPMLGGKSTGTLSATERRVLAAFLSKGKPLHGKTLSNVESKLAALGLPRQMEWSDRIALQGLQERSVSERNERAGPSSRPADALFAGEYSQAQDVEPIIHTLLHQAKRDEELVHAQTASPQPIPVDLAAADIADLLCKMANRLNQPAQQSTECDGSERDGDAPDQLNSVQSAIDDCLAMARCVWKRRLELGAETEETDTDNDSADASIRSRSSSDTNDSD